MPVRRWCETQADEAGPLDDDPLVDSVNHVGLLLYQIGLLPGFGQGIEPPRRAAGRQVPDRLRPHDLKFAAEARHPREVLRVVKPRRGMLQGAPNRPPACSSAKFADLPIGMLATMSSHGPPILYRPLDTMQLAAHACVIRLIQGVV